MKGFHKVITFKMWNTYANVRAITDDIIESMNRHCKPENAVTYSSTIKEVFLCTLGDIFSSVDEDDQDIDSYIDDKSSMDEYSCWVIRIYRCDGNRGSRLSSLHHQDIDNDSCISKPKRSFLNDYMEMYRLDSKLKFTVDRYKSMKEFSDEESVRVVRIECTGRMKKLLSYVEELDKMYPIEMKEKEVEVNEVLRHVADCLNLFESNNSCKE